jgi:hypothetical protein
VQRRRQQLIFDGCQGVLCGVHLLCSLALDATRQGMVIGLVDRAPDCTVTAAPYFVFNLKKECTI